MRNALRLSIVLLAMLSSAAAEPPIELFDGESLQGWVKRGGKARFAVVDGMIVGRTAANSPNTFLCTEKRFTNFELTVAFRCDRALNSGVQFRSNCFATPTSYALANGKSQSIPAGRVHGYQFEIDPDRPERMWAGGIYDEARRAWLYPGPAGGEEAQFTQQGKALFQPDTWNSLRVVCRGDHIQTWLNGEKRSDFHDDATAEGFIALQVHGVGDREDPLEVRFRKLILTPLP